MYWNLLRNSCASVTSSPKPGALRHRRLLVHAALVCDLDHPIQRLSNLDRALGSVGNDIGESDSTVTARLLERNLARLEELDERRPADAEQISRLLGYESSQGLFL